MNIPHSFYILTVNAPTLTLKTPHRKTFFQILPYRKEIRLNFSTISTNYFTFQNLKRAYVSLTF